MIVNPDPQSVLAAFRRPVPRYTSYPAAPHFKHGMGISVLGEALERLDDGEEVSVYVHIPYCDRLCWFCGCHTKHTLKYAPVADYLDSVIAELKTLRRRLKSRPNMTQLHFGGGSPSMLRHDDFARLMAELRQVFHFDEECEISIEIDPNDVDEAAIAAFAACGVTRASIGVQDFNEAVQAAINRPQGFSVTAQIVGWLRQYGVRSINIDALYGLPLQTEERLLTTAALVSSLRPNRIALFGYAHVPWMKKHQRMIKDDDLPSIEERLVHAQAAGQLFEAAGYRAIGIDHFALPDDGLALAADQGRLHRNFQGYTTDACQTLIGLGASSIGRTPHGYYQNVVAIGQYRALVEAGELAADKGLVLTADDQIRSWMIERLMCDFTIDYSAMLFKFADDARPYIATARQIAAQDHFGLCNSDENGFSIGLGAKPFTRIVASWFDAYYAQSEARYSKAV